MTQTEEDYQRTWRSEKSRTVVLLGFLSIILTVRVELHDMDFWNFPWWCDNSCPHFTIWLLPTFTIWIGLWIGYIGCMLIYFSEDRFDKYSWGRTFRDFFRRLGLRFFVIFYPLTVVFFGSFAGASFQLPDLVQGPYWLAVSSFLAIYAIWFLEGVVGTGVVFGKHSILNRLTDKTVKLAGEGMTILAKALIRLWRGVASKFGYPITGPTNAKRAMRMFIVAIELIVVVFGWFFGNLSGFALSYALAGPLYVILVISGVLGWYDRRKRKSKDKLGTA